MKYKALDKHFAQYADARVSAICPCCLSIGMHRDDIEAGNYAKAAWYCPPRMARLWNTLRSAIFPGARFVITVFEDGRVVRSNKKLAGGRVFSTFRGEGG